MRQDTVHKNVRGRVLEKDVALSDVDREHREKIARYIVYFSIGAISLIATAIIFGGIYAAVESGNLTSMTDTSQLVFSALLPLFGTWVGTILAFYFSKENFKVANDATRELFKSAGIRLSETSVREAMIPRAGIIAPVIAPGGKIDDVPFAGIEAAFAKEFASGRKVTRLVFLDDKGVCLIVLHRSIWDEMHRIGAKATPAVDFATGKLGAMLALKTDADPSRTYRQFLTDTLAYVGLQGTLADVKSRMEAIIGCQDAVVTDTGSRTEPMLGWVTNVEIQKVLKV